MKNQPVRMCSGCMARKEKGDLIRVVKNASGEVSLDLSGKKPGRGVYICKDVDCLRKAQKAKRFERSFSAAIPLEIFESLEKELMEVDT